MMLLAGTGAESTRATIELTKEAAGRGVDAVLVNNPFYYKGQMTSDVYRAHFSSVADASPVPVILYNVPVFTGISMEAKAVIELSKHPNIVGLKESSGDVRLISEVVWNAPKRQVQCYGWGRPVLFPNMMGWSAWRNRCRLACAAPKSLFDAVPGCRGWRLPIEPRRFSASLRQPRVAVIPGNMASPDSRQRWTSKVF